MMFFVSTKLNKAFYTSAFIFLTALSLTILYFIISLILKNSYSINYFWEGIILLSIITISAGVIIFSLAIKIRIDIKKLKNNAKKSY